MFINLLSAHRAAIELDLEQAKANLTAVIGATHLPRLRAIDDELERRVEVIETAWQTSTLIPPAHTTPRACAIRSVAHDIQMGWL